ALVFWFTTKDGEKKKITGYNWYMHYAMMFPEADYWPFWQPPHAPGDLPHYVSTYRGRWTYEHSPLEWPVDCSAGMHWPGMEWNGEVSFRTDDYEWFIWWRGSQLHRRCGTSSLPYGCLLSGTLFEFEILPGGN
ncbi:unnamed protein product, partial [marine sediment metagenome]